MAVEIGGAVDQALVRRAIRASADVTEVDWGHGFCASVSVLPGRMAVAHLDVSLRGAAHEGAVLRAAMERTARLFGERIFTFWTSPGGILIR